jgi:hypothetical protein
MNKAQKIVLSSDEKYLENEFWAGESNKLRVLVWIVILVLMPH